MSNGETKQYWFRGRRYTVPELAETYQAQTNHLSSATIYNRINNRWSVEETLLIPLGKKRTFDNKLVYCERCHELIAKHSKCRSCEMLIHDELYSCLNKHCIYSHGYSADGRHCLSCTKHLKYGILKREIDEAKKEKERKKAQQARKTRLHQQKNGRMIRKWQNFKIMNRCPYCEEKIDQETNAVLPHSRTVTTEHGKTQISLLIHTSCELWKRL